MTPLDVTVHEPEAASATADVVLVHGALDRSANFAAVASALPEMRVVRYTRRGYDGSGEPGGASVDTHVADLLHLVDRPSLLIGHSYGALIVLAAAVERPDRITGVGVYEPPMPWEPWWPRAFHFDDPAGAGEVFFRRVVGDGAWESLPERFREARRQDGPALVADVSAAVDGPPFALADVLSPVSAAYGSLTLPEFRRAAETVAAQVHGGSLTEIAGAAHGGHMTHPSAFADWIRSVAGTAS